MAWQSCGGNAGCVERSPVPGGGGAGSGSWAGVCHAPCRRYSTPPVSSSSKDCKAARFLGYSVLKGK